MKSEGSCNLVLILVSWLSRQSDMLRLHPRHSLISPFASLAYSLLLYVPSITVRFNLSIFLYYTSLHSASPFLGRSTNKIKALFQALLHSGLWVKRSVSHSGRLILLRILSLGSQHYTCILKLLVFVTSWPRSSAHSNIVTKMISS